MAKKSIENSTLNSLERLTSQRKSPHKLKISYKLEKEVEDLRECSFTPNLTQTINKTEWAHWSENNGRTPRFEQLYNKHQEKINRNKYKSAKKKVMELEECTFIPKVKNTTLSLKKYNHNCIKERNKIVENTEDREAISTPKKKPQLFQSELSQYSAPHERLYADNKKYQKNKRIYEFKQRKGQKEKCPFTPKKHSTLEFKYRSAFKDSGTRLYNNYFEIQDKLSIVKESRNKELQSMSERRTAPNINVSITNNYISSVNLESRGRSVKNSKPKDVIL